jgi:GTPase
MLVAPRVAIVGRTNVGKSTLFNRLIEEHKSLVSDIPGTTRDRYEGDCIWRGMIVRFIDTGGLDVDKSDEVDLQIAEQAYTAMNESDLVLFLVDLKTGPQQEDQELAKQLQDSGTPVLLVGNKGDNKTLRAAVNDKQWHTWPLGIPMAVSAARGIGIGDMLDEVYKKLEEVGAPPVHVRELIATRVAVAGRPNVGKSSLVNSILGEHRYITSDREHTTRGPNDSLITVDGQNYLFIDTAGVRKMARVNAGKSKLEKSGVEGTLRAVKSANVVLFVIDMSQEIHTQDKHLAGEIAKSASSAIIVANKWDLIPDKDSKTINEYEKYLRSKFPSLSYAPIVFTSAVTGQRVQNLFEIIDEVYDAQFTQLSLEETKSFISRAIVKHKPSRGKGVAHPQIMSFKQVGIRPPRFELAIRHKKKDVLADSYLKFLANQLRKIYKFPGTPIIIRVRTKQKSHTTMG